MLPICLYSVNDKEINLKWQKSQKVFLKHLNVHFQAKHSSYGKEMQSFKCQDIQESKSEKSKIFTSLMTYASIYFMYLYLLKHLNLDYIGEIALESDLSFSINIVIHFCSFK